MFETFAALSTISCIVVFVALYKMDRAGRDDESAPDQRTPSGPRA
jgi:hypothetical protein